MNNVKKLLYKDIKNSLRNPESLYGVIAFNVLLTIVITFFYRSVQIEISEVSVFCLPLLWTIYIITIMKFVLQFLSEESKKSLFFFQVRDGYSSTHIFLSKLICTCTVGALIVFIQVSIFTLLLGFTSYLFPLFSFAVLCILSLPAISSISIISALISQRGQKEELLMPILTLPMVLFISISVLNYAEILFENGFFDYQNFWFKVIVIMQVLYGITCNLMFGLMCTLRVR